MNCYTARPKRNKRHNEFMFPHFGNMLNEMMRTTLSDVVTADKEKSRYSTPAVNVIEKNDRFILRLAVPGMTKKDIDIQIEDGYITIKSEKVDEKNTDKFHLKEFNYSKFKRKFKLPESAEMDDISARFKNGVLEIDIPKREDKIDKGPKSVKIS